MVGCSALLVTFFLGISAAIVAFWSKSEVEALVFPDKYACKFEESGDVNPVNP